MGMFDQNGRQASKLDGGAFFHWLLQRIQPPPPLVFDHWDDSRRLPLPGGPDRTDDLVGVLRRTDRPEQFVHLLVEIETEPERQLFQRLGIYGLMLSCEVSPGSGPANELPVGCAINLTGERPASGLGLTVAGTGIGIWVKPLIVNLCRESARLALTAIAEGRLGLPLLSWIPLMAGGGEPELIEEWKRIAQTEPDAQRRAAYRDFALVFAELTRELVNWQRALEGWEMKESQYIKGWMREGEIKGILSNGRDDLFIVLGDRLQEPIPEEVRLAVEGTNDPDTLKRWLRAALKASTWVDFRAAMKNGA